MSDPIKLLLDQGDWKETHPCDAADALPYATHEGILTISGVTLRVAQLSNGERVINAEDLERLFPGFGATVKPIPFNE